jgi:endonuclease/exonuclease/phosphatase family metal-dependent hydrolase
MLSSPLIDCHAIHWGEQAACTPPPSTAPSRAPVAQSGIVLHALSWNLHGAPSAGPMDARLGRVAGEILRRHPDLVLLQEAWFADDARQLQDALSGHYLRVADDPDVSDSSLSRLTGLRRGGLLAFVARGSAWRPEGPSRFERFRAGPPWWRSLLAQGDGLAEKGMQSFTLVHPGMRIAVANTHLQARYAADTAAVRHDAEIRARQVAQLLHDIAPAPAVAVTLLFGDFNVHPDEGPYRQLTQDWVDLTRGLQCPTCATRLSHSGRSGGWVDYVFARVGPGIRLDPHMTMITNAAVDCPYSDHHGLELRVGIETHGAGATGATRDATPDALQLARATGR